MISTRTTQAGQRRSLGTLGAGHTESWAHYTESWAHRRETETVASSRLGHLQHYLVTDTQQSPERKEEGSQGLKTTTLIHI